MWFGSEFLILTDVGNGNAPRVKLHIGCNGLRYGRGIRPPQSEKAEDIAKG